MTDEDEVLARIVPEPLESGIELGALTAAIFLPVLLVGPWAGQVIDRVNRRVLLMGTQIAFFVIGAVLVVVTWVGADSLPVLYAVALATGIVNAFDGPARQVYLMDVLPRPMLQAAIGLYESLGFVNFGLRRRYYRSSGADAYTMGSKTIGSVLIGKMKIAGD
jgi:MFS family permease